MRIVNMTAFLAGIFASSAALAYDNCLNAPGGVCPAVCGEIISGSSQDYRIEASGFTSTQIDQIVIGANMWAAGPSEIMRGADWHFTRGADVTTGAFLNGRPEVFARDLAWRTTHFADPTAPGVSHMTFAGCSRTSMDMVLQTEMLAGTGSPNNYKNSRPSVGNQDDHSLAQIVAHEFGHWFGLDHEDAFISLMNSKSPCGGDIGAAFRINENELVALQEFKPDGSTGNNILLSKFSMSNINPPPKAFLFEPNYTEKGRGDCFNAGELSSAKIQAVTLSTSTVSGVVVQWSLSPDDNCSDNNNIFSGSNTGLVLAMGSPSSFQANTICVPTNAPIGVYRLCVTIDPNNAISETSESDNTIRFTNTVNITH